MIRFWPSSEQSFAPTIKEDMSYLDILKLEMRNFSQDQGNRGISFSRGTMHRAPTALYVAQVIPMIDTDIAENSHFPLQNHSIRLDLSFSFFHLYQIISLLPDG
jgi:hypothetical protein